MRKTSLLLASAFLSSVLCIQSSAIAAPKLNTPTPEAALVENAVPSKLAQKNLLIAVAKANGGLVAVGQWGHILLSGDGGATWRQAKTVPTRLLLTALYFADDKNGWAVGHDMVILHTADGGETWDMQYSEPPAEAPLLTVWFENAEHGIATGAFSTMLETFDSGKTWTKRPMYAVTPDEIDQPHFNHFFTGPGGKSQLILAAEAGHVYRSLDSGRTWADIPVPYEGSIWGGMTTKQGRILALGMRGNLFISDDLGDNWRLVSTGTDQSLTSGTQLSNGDIVVVGLGGVVLVSKDNAETFSVAIRPTRSGQSGVAELGTAGDKVLIFGEAGIEEYALNPATAAAQ